MANSRDADELDEFYPDAGRKNLLLQIKNPLAWYNAARRSMLQANMIRRRIEEDIPVENEGLPRSMHAVFKPSRSGDIFWLQTLRAAIRNDLAVNFFVGKEVDIQSETSIDKHGIDTLEVPQYRKLHPLYPAYLHLIGEATENLLKAIYVMKNTDSIYSDSDEQIIEEIKRRSHNLRSLAVDWLHLELNEAEKRLLRMLQAFIEWAGKYPGPKNPDQYLEFIRGKNYPNPFSVKEQANYSKDEITIHNLYGRLIETLDSEASKRLQELSS